MKSRRAYVVVLVAVLGGSATASAHITMTSPRPRDSGQKSSPCGTAGSTRGDRISIYQPGETITVTWDETVEHNGHFRIAFDLDGNDDFPNPNVPDDNFPSTLLDQIPHRQGGGGYGQDITFPDQECENCTLQLIQVMTTQVPYNSFYFQCADITLSRSLPGSPDADVSGVGDSIGPCSCSSHSRGSTWTALFLLLALAPLRRRRSHEFSARQRNRLAG